MILLKTACFSIWLTMILALSLAKQTKSNQLSIVSVYLDDPERAELQIRKSLNRLSPGERLRLDISSLNPARSELYFIASRICRKNPSIYIKVFGIMEN